MWTVHAELLKHCDDQCARAESMRVIAAASRTNATLMAQNAQAMMVRGWEARHAAFLTALDWEPDTALQA